MRQLRVSQKTAKAIREFHALLKEDCGCDYSFSIVGHGYLIAASNARRGNIEPQCVRGNGWTEIFVAEKKGRP